jgi:hypothetical protein
MQAEGFSPLDNVLSFHYTAIIIVAISTNWGERAMELASELLRNIGTLSRSVQSMMDVKFRSYGLKRG